MAISLTGIWDQETADTGHVFSYKLAKWIAEYLPKDVHVNDLGCGKGTYLTYLFDRGYRKIRGIEGCELNDFELEAIDVWDLSKPFQLENKGNTICLEVIEHIPFELSKILFDNICSNTAKGCKIITSCAIPGQGGDGHVNCRSNLWVINEMQKRGYSLNIDDSIAARSVIENYCKWFRETILIFE